MRIPQLRLAAIALAAGIGLSGCATYDPYRVRHGGLGRLRQRLLRSLLRRLLILWLRLAYGYGYSVTAVRLWIRFAVRLWLRSPMATGRLFGWNDGFYYPGTGIYVYDRSHHRHQWSDSQRHYWTERRNKAAATGQTVTRDELEGRTGQTARELERRRASRRSGPASRAATDGAGNGLQSRSRQRGSNARTRRPLRPRRRRTATAPAAIVVTATSDKVRRAGPSRPLAGAAAASRSR